MQQRHHCPPPPTQPTSSSHTDMSVSESNDTPAQSGHSGFKNQIRKNKHDLGNYFMEMLNCNKSYGSIYDSTNETNVGFI